MAGRPAGHYVLGPDADLSDRGITSCPLPVALLTPLRRRLVALTDYAAGAALVAVLPIGALVIVGDRSRGLLADAGRAALVLDPHSCVLPDQETSPPLPLEEAAEPELETPSGALPLATVGQGYLFQFQISAPKGRQITFLAPGDLLPPASC